MSKRKPKPATAGEKTVLRVTNSELQAKYRVRLKELRTSRVYAPARKTAAAIDRAIARAVRKERERCGFVVFAAKCNCESFDWAHQWILHPEKQKP